MNERREKKLDSSKHQQLLMVVDIVNLEKKIYKCSKSQMLKI